MTDVQAAMGRIQLGRLNEFVEKRSFIKENFLQSD